ncbi:VOC family protein [Namhaeicola litoreus]|uniref:VOC family protein n=1 Tax=Namhaeicola litoreus TaxID=1052145 RepID=A0ABW3Y4U3_9FLAO
MKLLNQTIKFYLTLVLVGVLVMSCARIDYPSISSNPTNNYQYGQVIWHDLITPNPEKAMEFYASMFGWTYETLGKEGSQQYHVIYNNGKAIGGIIELNATEHPAGEWLSSISVPDVEKAVAYNTQKGGKTMFKIAHFQGRGKSALVRDPQGAYISFVHSDSGDPTFVSENNNWLWNELWTSDLDASLIYYQGLVPYKANKVEGQTVPYFLFENNGNKLSGVMKNPVENMRSAWVPYIKVTDVNAISEKAETLGAVIMLEPDQSIRNNTVAIIQDPNGAPFAVQIWNN